MTQALVPVLFLTDPSDAPCSVPFSRASANSVRLPWRWQYGPVSRSTALEFSETASFFRCLRGTSLVVLSLKIRVWEVRDRSEILTAFFGGELGIPDGLYIRPWPALIPISL